MQNGLIITCPEHDDATAYLTFFSKEITDGAEKRSLKIKKVTKKELNICSFSKILTKLGYRLVVLNGHGSHDSVFGYKNNLIVKLGKNDRLLKERLVYARSCNAGTELGPNCMEGSKDGCFIGYDVPFIFYMDSEWTTKPHNDKVAKLFLEPSNLIPVSIIKGNSAIESHNNAKDQMLKMMNNLIKGEQKQETPFYLEALWNNYQGQVIYGNAESKL